MNKLIDCNYNDDDIMIRPKTINEYIGQDKVLNNIKVFYSTGYRFFMDLQNLEIK